jgi:hypothetical protein
MSSSGEYGYKFILNGTTDITGKVKSFNIEASLEMYCRELSFELTDEDLYDSFDFSIIPEAPTIEVFTRVTALGAVDEYDEYDEYDDPAWVSQGIYYIERPTYSIGINETSLGIWGRQSTAILGEPFAQKTTKLWEVDTTFYQICQEIVESVGLVWDSTRCDIQDFKIYADNFEADDQYPIEVLQSLVELAVGEEGFVTCDRLGYVCIKRLDRSPSVADFDITDLSVQTFNEEPEWPEFGNRIKIIPSETVSQDKVELFMDRECLGTGAATSIDVYAQVCNGDGTPINNAVISWSFALAAPRSVWFKYSNNVEGFYKTALQNTTRILVSRELQKATGFHSIEVKFAVESVVGIWAYSDKNRVTNLCPEGSYTIDGKIIHLVDVEFAYCDQTVFVSYYASGMAKNNVLYEIADGVILVEPTGVDDVGDVMSVIAEVSGRQSFKDLYIDNPCQCVTTLTVETVDLESTTPTAPVVVTPYARIIATTYGNQMPLGESQALWAWEKDKQSQIPAGTVFTWTLTGYGSLSATQGVSVILTAPPMGTSDPNGVYTTIKLYQDGTLKQTAMFSYRSWV